MLRPDIARAVELNILALVFPSGDGREARGHVTGLGPEPWIHRRPGRTPGDAAQWHRAIRGSEVFAIGKKMRVRVEISAGGSVGRRVFDLLIDRVGIDHDAHRASEMLLPQPCRST